MQQFHSWPHTQRKQEINSKRYLHPVFIEAPLTIAKTWKQVSMADQWINKLWCTCIYNRILFSHLKKKPRGNPAISSNMDGPWGHYAMSNRSHRERWMNTGWPQLIYLKQNTKKKRKIPKHIGKKIRLVARGRGWREGNQRVVGKLKVLVMEKQVLGCDAQSDNYS